MQTNSAASKGREEFRNLSSFVGGLLRNGAMDRKSAQEMLVSGFWEIEEESAYDKESEDLLAFAKDYCKQKQLVSIAG